MKKPVKRGEFYLDVASGHPMLCVSLTDFHDNSGRIVTFFQNRFGRADSWKVYGISLVDGQLRSCYNPRTKYTLSEAIIRRWRVRLETDKPKEGQGCGEK